MTRRIISVVIVAVFTIATAGTLAGCGTPEPLTGTVIEKEYEPSTRTCRKAGRKCTTKPECYEVDVQKADGDIGEVCVTKEQFDALKVGEFVSNLTKN